MIRLSRSLAAWKTDGFDTVLKDEIRQLDAAVLPLQQGLSQGSVALDDRLDVIIISTSTDTSTITVKTGIGYHGIVAGCACVDDPTPENETTEYCEVLFCIDKQTGDTVVTLIE